MITSSNSTMNDDDDVSTGDLSHASTGVDNESEFSGPDTGSVATSVGGGKFGQVRLSKLMVLVVQVVVAAALGTLTFFIVAQKEKSDFENGVCSFCNMK